MSLLSLAALPLFCAPGPQLAAESMPVILPMRERAELRDRWCAQRLEELVPALMRESDIDMWVLIAREYNEDPVLATMLPATWMAARRRTILVFFDPGADEPVERLAVSRYDIGSLFESAWDKEQQPDQLRRLVEIIRERSPRSIALNRSRDFALADGLSQSEYATFVEAIGPELAERVVSAEPLAIGWLETRTPEELAVYPSICRIAHRILAEALSDRAVQPGHTTTTDLGWWLRDRVVELGLDTWFHPSVSVQRRDSGGHSGSFASKPGEQTIQRGDLIHIDFGITYLGLNTDTQQHAYVLRAGEEDAPEGLRRAFSEGNRVQDLLTSRFALGRSGNELLRATLEAAQAAGLQPSIYTHPLGFHGHGAGPLIGLWDQQEGVPGRGDYTLRANTAYAIELGTLTTVPEWDDQEVRIMLEEDALFDGQRVRYLDGRQTELILIP